MIKRKAVVELNVNGQTHQLDIDPQTPLLWVLREYFKLTGTKYGCGIQNCGSCTVHVNGKAVRSCSETLEEVAGKNIITIEVSQIINILFSALGLKLMFLSATTVNLDSSWQLQLSWK